MEISFRQLLMLGIFWSFCFHLNVGSVRSQCLEDQQSLLIQFKKNLTFNSTLSTKLVSWNSSTDCCAWGGVDCDSGGNVVGLDLGNETISGEIDSSSSLFHLHHLQTIDLSSNNFNGSRIPSGFGKLANLQRFNLYNSNFTGQIPVEISGLRGLVSLNLSTYGDPVLELKNPNLSILLRNLTRLTELDLSGIDLSAEGYGWCRALSSLTRLKVLSLAFCKLFGPIDSSLAKLRSLSVINLASNSDISSPVPEFFGNFSNLTSLDLYDCDLFGKFPEKVFQLPHLQNLDASYNIDLQGAMPEFPKNGPLETLQLQDTKFGGHLPESIGHLKRLSLIRLGGCNFNGPIPYTIGRLTQLVFVGFSYNNFSGPIPSFSSAKNLSVLNLDSNQLSGSILSTNWSGLTQLRSLDMHNNSLTGAIPASLFGLPSLESIHLYQNQFTRIAGKLSGSASSALDHIDLSKNSLEGPFPVVIFQVQSLSYLVLSFNNLSGPVKLSSFQQLKNLSHLDLSNNNLSSIDESGVHPAFFPQLTLIGLGNCDLNRFPDFLKGQSSLSSLDLSNNKIGGEIPDWIWRLQNLNYLNISHNFLDYIFPSTIKLPPYLSDLDLSGNNLQGELPKPSPISIYVDFSSNSYSSVIPGEFPESIQFFSVANNNLQGSIPPSICNATSLEVLNLSNNSLTGTIPGCLLQMNSTVVLNLKGNKLRGNISDTFSNSCPVQTLDLNGNQLQGKIPMSLASCGNLEVLDLGNNQISDTFPCHLKSVSSLRVLVLRSNLFQGPIRCSSGNSSWQMLQIVDLASNNFSGELQIRFLRTWKAMMDGEDEGGEIPSNYGSSYHDSIVVTTKGHNYLLVKILVVFTLIDVSCNKLQGMLPEVIGDFKALHTLNMSHNSLTGPIPSSFGNLLQLDSMDLSSNHLTGMIPQQLASLTFIGVLNLSYNDLVGRIPTSTQLQTRSNDSYLGNIGLCGPPLTKSCGDDRTDSRVPPKESSRANDEDGILTDSMLLSVGLGFIFGLGTVILPLTFWRRWRIWYFKQVDFLLSKCLPHLHHRSINHGSRTSRRSRTQLRNN